MKLIKLPLLVLAIGLAVVSCKKDDDPAQDISGLKFETTNVKIEVTGEDPVEFNTKAELQEEELYWVIEFKADGKLYVDDEESGTWKQSGSTITVTDDDEGESTGSISGDIITITESDSMDGIGYKMTMKFTKI